MNNSLVFLTYFFRISSFNLQHQLESVASYEFRRRIRNQIRIVKKQIEEKLQQAMVTEEEEDGQETVTTTTTTTRKESRSPVRKISASSPVRKSSRTEQQMSTSSSSTRQSSVQRTITRDETVEQRSSSPAKMGNKTKVTTVTTTTTNGRGPKTNGQPQDEKPIWAQKNILKKASENTRTITSTSNGNTRKVVDQKPFSRPKTSAPVSGQPKESQVTDCCVTSSYGIGPTDDNGKPIFGLRALKKKANNTSQDGTTTVTGTIVQESYYSENGGPATGQRTVTMYSNDEDQLKGFNGKRVKDTSIERENSTNTRKSNNNTNNNKIVTVTKTQRMVAGEVEPLITTTTSSTHKNNTITRRGSVKEMSEKFIQKESEAATKVNGSSSYPKAGLILRTQSTRSRSSTDGDEAAVEMRSKSGRTVTRTRTTEKYNSNVGASDQDMEDEEEDNNHTRSSSTRTTTTTRSFLNSGGEKVTNVDDVLDRMRNADNGGWKI